MRRKVRETEKATSNSRHHGRMEEKKQVSRFEEIPLQRDPSCCGSAEKNRLVYTGADGRGLRTAAGRDQVTEGKSNRWNVRAVS